ncbi:hypothetical protein V6N11_002733 [Hibiscus sabdariffa]|uniref:Uncharacterized protein n=1 Tax=Hibiscus sabdariffa TaxID=183260 RepID=A0ABR2SB45_9ROSI
MGSLTSKGKMESVSSMEFWCFLNFRATLIALLLILFFRLSKKVYSKFFHPSSSSTLRLPSPSSSGSPIDSQARIPEIISDLDLKFLVDNLDEKLNEDEKWENVINKKTDFLSYNAKCCRPKASKILNFLGRGIKGNKGSVPGRDASEIRMFHQEDAGLNVERAKLAFAKGIWSYVCKMDNALRKYSAINSPLTTPSVLSATLIQKVPPELDMISGNTLPAVSASMATLEPVNDESREKKLSRIPSKKTVAKSLLVAGGVICLSRGHTGLGAKVAIAFILTKLRKHCDSSSQSRRTRDI